MTRAASGQCPICDNAAKIVQIVDEKHPDCNKVTCPLYGVYVYTVVYGDTYFIPQLCHSGATITQKEHE